MLQFFAPLVKVDEAQHLVYGTAALEQVDKTDEIFDYATSKPHFLAWSESLSKSSNGRNLGNVRAMHGSVAAGHLVEVSYDDDNKKIDVCAKITDDNEWKKVVEGTYTGFSIGGKYLRKWSDPSNPIRKRYTARPSEVTLADNPCMPGATFTMTKSDGAVAQVEARGLEGGASPASDPRDHVYQVWCCKTMGHEHFEKADAVDCVEKMNDNHDEHGRFAAGQGGPAQRQEVAHAHENAARAHQAAAEWYTKNGASEEIQAFPGHAIPKDKNNELTRAAEDQSRGAATIQSIYHKQEFTAASVFHPGMFRDAAVAHQAMATFHQNMATKYSDAKKIETGDGLAKTEENEMNEQEKNELTKTVSSELQKTFTDGLADLRKTILEPLAKTIADNKTAADAAIEEVKKTVAETNEAIETLSEAITKILATPAEEPNKPALKVVPRGGDADETTSDVHKVESNRLDSIKESLRRPASFGR